MLTANACCTTRPTNAVNGPTIRTKSMSRVNPGREGPAAAEQSRDPPIERIAQSREKRTEEQRNQERPGHREEGNRDDQDEKEDERRSKGGPTHVGTFHGQQYDPVVV